MVKSSDVFSNRTALFPARFASLADIGEFVARAAHDCGLEPADVYAVQLAVDEASTNIIEHAYGGESQNPIYCTCRIADEGLTIILRDCGHPFDPSQVITPDLQASLEERRTGGLGLYFMRHLMDDVHFSVDVQAVQSGACGNILTMVKRKERSA